MRSKNRTAHCYMRSKQPCYLDGGFGAVMAVLLVASGVSAMSLTVLGAAVSYSDSVYSRELRVQNSLNSQACADTAALIKDRGVFATGIVHLAEFDCDVDM